jgi:hypothetical protein
MLRLLYLGFPQSSLFVRFRRLESVMHLPHLRACYVILPSHPFFNCEFLDFMIFSIHFFTSSLGLEIVDAPVTPSVSVLLESFKIAGCVVSCILMYAT